MSSGVSGGRTRVAVALLLCLTLLGLANGQKSGEASPRVLNPAELFKILEESKVRYLLTTPDEGAEMPPFEHPGWPIDEFAEARTFIDPTYVVTESEEGGLAISTYQFSDALQEALELAERHFQAGKMEAALVAYRGALEVDPQCFVVHSHIGDALLAIGHPEEALAHYEKAVALNPRQFRGHWYRASALLKLGRFEDARRSYARALALAPGYERLIGAIEANAEDLGITFQPEIYQPHSVARLDEEGVTIIVDPESVVSVAEGVCRGVWMGEDALRKERTGSEDHHWTSHEELECLGAAAQVYLDQRDGEEGVRDERFERILAIFEAGDARSLVLYESGKHFGVMLTSMLPDQQFDALTAFVETWVLVPVAED